MDRKIDAVRGYQRSLRGRDGPGRQVRRRHSGPSLRHEGGPGISLYAGASARPSSVRAPAPKHPAWPPSLESAASRAVYRRRDCRSYFLRCSTTHSSLAGTPTTGESGMKLNGSTRRGRNRLWGLDGFLTRGLLVVSVVAVAGLLAPLAFAAAGPPDDRPPLSPPVGPPDDRPPLSPPVGPPDDRPPVDPPVGPPADRPPIDPPVGPPADRPPIDPPAGPPDDGPPGLHGEGPPGLEESGVPGLEGECPPGLGEDGPPGRGGVGAPGLGGDGPPGLEGECPAGLAGTGRAGE